MLNCARNVDLSRVNRFRVGGVCDVLFSPPDVGALQNFSREFRDMPRFVLGAGSNVLIRDGGFRGVCIRLGAGFSIIERRGGDAIYVGAGTLNSRLAYFCAREGLDGLSFLSSIPGRFGGALAMNAGCYGRETRDIVDYVDIMGVDGAVRTLSAGDIPWAYRSSGLPSDVVFLGAQVRVSPSSTEDVWRQVDRMRERREKTQPVFSRTCGSTFKNPPGRRAWELIASAGCAGLHVGDAHISSMHCNFIVNAGRACAKDIEILGDIVRQRVFERHGILLEWEIRIIGDEL